jgi:type VI secretion system protein ImpG
VLRLVLECQNEKLTFAELPIPKLRFFLKGQPQFVYRLYELIFNNVLTVALATSPSDTAPVILSPEALQPVGFAQDEGLLPYSARSFMGYRLLTEYFAFPEKFLFVDLVGIPPRALDRLSDRLEIFLFLNRSGKGLGQNLTDVFRLGCTPIVNLYTQRAEPISLTHHDVEYRIVPDARRPLAHEIHSIQRVVATSPDDHQLEFMPFFSVKHASAETAASAFWYAARKSAENTRDVVDQGTEMHLSLVDLNLDPAAPADWTVDVETICLNRDLPHQLPFGGGQPSLRLSEGGLVSRILCLTPPTATLRPARRKGVLWRLISHLSLNHLSLVDNGDNATALREILKLYDFVESAETSQMIGGIVGITSKRVVGRISGSIAGALCRGVEITVCFDEGRFSGSGLYLFASVLERFFAMYCTVNSFTRMVATVQGKEGELRRWKPRVGEKVIV